MTQTEPSARRVRLPLTAIQSDPRNSNRFNGDQYAKVKAHIQSTGNVPTPVVRELPRSSRFYRPEQDGPQYMALDGHHRVQILIELGHPEWDVDTWGEMTDEQALLYLMSLNTSRGEDDPNQRAANAVELLDVMPIDQIALVVTEDERGIQDLVQLRQEYLDLVPPEETEPDTEEEAEKATAVAMRYVVYPDQHKSVVMALSHIMSTLEGLNKTGRAYELLAVDYLSGLDPAERDALERAYLDAHGPGAGAGAGTPDPDAGDEDDPFKDEGREEDEPGEDDPNAPRDPALAN